jgi:uncharacterized protein with PIN domain
VGQARKSSNQETEIMDDRDAAVAKKLENLLSETAEAAVELSRLDGTVKGVPHYSVIELHAHELGKQLSRQIQQRQMNEVAADQLRQHPCPSCGTNCEVTVNPREVGSIDGAVELQEIEGYCRKCRRSFFPESRSVGI